MRDAAPTTRVLVVAIMVSMVAFLSSAVANLALPATQRDLGGGLWLQQWVVGAYLLALAATVLPAGSIADQFGRIPVMRFGLTTFGVGAVLAASATSPLMLIVGRVVQGFGGAFLVPGSVALINSAYEPADRPAAIGTWTAWTGTAFALGPLMGGLAVDYLSWRWIYLLLVVPIVVSFALTFWLIPMPGPPTAGRVDIAGAALSAFGLTATVWALIEAQQRGWDALLVNAAFVVGGVALLAFVAWERRTPHPMLPLGLLTIRNLVGANLATAFVYGGLTLGSIVIALYAQEIAGYSATAAGLVMLPTPILSFLFARYVGVAAARYGPKLFVMGGAVLAGVGFLLIHPSAQCFNVATRLMPGMIVVATGLVLTITPLTSLNLSAVAPEYGGMAAAIQNVVGRTSALTAVACVGLVVAGSLTDASFSRVLRVSAVLFFVAAMICASLVRDRAVPAESVPCEVAALCVDQHELLADLSQPDLTPLFDRGD
ncbi:MFS transporter [Mycobacterium shigaense]|uniref:MFS transporter n=1 Tax=Mycobacterium shigaense TaxID=722731 RepID=A0A1Z4EK87_9MYCO|nr:MFS transporter [Mycobacterium shigaense]PRI15970.1 MFS transporter [Mycobacterium shigaense]BAX93395.1 MFS transporter [Mycobacterium shigaense]